MADDLDSLEQEVKESQLAIADKIEQLQTQVSDSVESITSVAQEAVSDAADAIHTTAETVRSAVQNVGGVFDIDSRVQQHPWLSLAVAAASGFLVGELFFRQRVTRVELNPTEVDRLTSPTSSAPSGPSPNGGWLEAFGDGARSLVQNAVDGLIRALPWR